MRTDPRAACANEKEALFWALLHDAVAHPLMALTLYSKWSMRFHDYTSYRAWPRQAPAAPLGAVWLMRSRHFGMLQVRWLGGDLYQVAHPVVAHTFGTNASDAVEALEKAERHFEIMADDFGGRFSRVQ